jgi:hypothetical protein
MVGSYFVGFPFVKFLGLLKFYESAGETSKISNYNLINKKLNLMSKYKKILKNLQNNKKKKKFNEYTLVRKPINEYYTRCKHVAC